jgi:hypothetical protein
MVAKQIIFTPASHVHLELPPAPSLKKLIVETGA